MQQINWDSLRYVLAVAKMRSISAAARSLGVNRSTVLRRINQFQSELNCRLFEPTDSGYILTVEAEKLIEAAQDIEATIFNVQRQIAGQELKLEGELRVTTTDSFMSTIVGPHLSSFYEKHPNIIVELVVTNSILDLNRRDADIAIRPTRVPDPHLEGRKICNLDFGLYASSEYLAQTKNVDLFDKRWVGFDASLESTPPGIWFTSKVKNKSICMRCDSFVSIKIAASNSVGVALLPTMLGENDKNLVRLDYNIQELSIGLWLLTHPDLYRSARVHAFFDHFSDALGYEST
jgi:DNA-binding transcriptional LysR family regulator